MYNEYIMFHVIAFTYERNYIRLLYSRISRNIYKIRDTINVSCKIPTDQRSTIQFSPNK